MHNEACTIVIQLFQWNQMVDECLQSLAAQTLPPREIILMHRCEGEDLTILREKTARYSNIRLIRERGISLADALNQGIEMAQTDLIARMDVDDVALPERLALQVEFMEQHTDIAVCGTAFRVYETNESIRPPQENDAIRAMLLFSSPFCHPSVVFRKNAVQAVGGYDVSRKQVEDYDLWLRLAEAGMRLANLPQHLIRYRVHPNKDRRAVLKARREEANSLREDFYAACWGERLPLPRYIAAPTEMRISDIFAGWKWLLTLRKINSQKPFVLPKALGKELRKQALQCVKEYVKSRRSLSRIYKKFRTIRNYTQKYH